MEDIAAKFDHLFKVIESKEFLRMESLGGEIPFFISAYNIKQETDVEKAIKVLIKKLETNGIPVLELNLYDISIDLLEGKMGLDRIFKIEEKKSKTKFKRALQSSLNIHEVFMPKIEAMIEASDAKVYFLTGIGQVYPFMRSHNILNNLQNYAKKAPTIAFFPGIYTGLSLNLFGLMKDDNYYRAFNIENYKTKL